MRKVFIVLPPALERRAARRGARHLRDRHDRAIRLGIRPDLRAGKGALK
jgi:hypothetical protein